MSELRCYDPELAAKLRDEIGTVPWSWLRPHAERGVLFLVAGELDLLEVALAVAVDRSELVAGWLESGSLSRPADEQVADWEENGGLFSGVIVKPYVFVTTQPENDSKSLAE
jgi:hypothetical protein